MKMVPSTLPDEVPRSEQLVFDQLKHSPAKWTVFSNYSVPNYSVTNKPDTARPRELDFVILIPESCSVIYLEAKGGRYVYEDRKMRRVGGGEGERSPVKQAETGMFSLKKWWEEELNGDLESYLSFLNCVAFTDAEVNQKALDSTDVHKTSLLIGKGVATNGDLLVNELNKYAKSMSRWSLAKKRGTEYMYAQAQLKALENVMRQSLPVTDMTFYRSNLDTLLPELLELTDRQKFALTLMEDNRRCVFDGPAGTGKTVLAMEEVRKRCEKEGQTVGFLCSNPVLSHRFERWADTLSADNGGRVVAGTPLTLLAGAFKEDDSFLERCHGLADGSQLEESLKQGHLVSGWEDFVDQVVADLDHRDPVFDYLVIDEAQNLCDEVFLRLMDPLLKGGLGNGQWALFGDFRNQNIVTSRRHNSRDASLAPLRAFAEHVKCSLDTNCRNTHEIASSISTICKISLPTLAGVHGPEVDLQYFGSPEELRTLLDRQLSTWKANGFEDHQIILLASGEEGGVAPGREYGGWRLSNIRDTDASLGSEGDAVRVSGDRSNDVVRFSDVYDFQGLESDLVILVLPKTDRQTSLSGGITMPDYDLARRLLYTGMSRAGVMLCIMSHEGYRDFLEPPGL